MWSFFLSYFAQTLWSAWKTLICVMKTHSATITLDHSHVLVSQATLGPELHVQVKKFRANEAFRRMEPPSIGHSSHNIPLAFYG